MATNDIADPTNKLRLPLPLLSFGAKTAKCFSRPRESPQKPTDVWVAAYLDGRPKLHEIGCVISKYLPTSYKYGHLYEGPPLVVAAPLVPVGAGGRELRGTHQVDAAELTHQKILSRSKCRVEQKNGQS